MKKFATWTMIPAALALGACACGAKETPDTLYTALVSARFVSADAQTNQEAHDGVASATEELARSRGDVAHKTAIGLQDPQEFLAVDLWKSLDGMQEHFADPDFAGQLVGVFEGPPEITTWTAPKGWSNWGTLDPQPNHYLVVVQGTLVSDDLATNRDAHNAVADGGKETAMGLGDYAHLVHLDPENPRSFMAIDLWSDLNGLQQFFGATEVQEAFGSLFEAPPTITIYVTTEYHQW